MKVVIDTIIAILFVLFSLGFGVEFIHQKVADHQKAAQEAVF